MGDSDGSLRPIASGLRGIYAEHELLNRKVVVVCNLKEAKLQGFLSFGMVLAAKASSTAMELVDPPSLAVPGDRVFCDGVGGNPLSSAKIKKGKVWEAVAAELKTTADCKVTWRASTLKTSSGECTVKSLASSIVA